MSANINIARFADEVWDTSIVPTLCDYIRIPNKSPAFDPDWETAGHMQRAAALLDAWCEHLDIQGLRHEIFAILGGRLGHDVADQETVTASVVPNHRRALAHDPRQQHRWPRRRCRLERHVWQRFGRQRRRLALWPIRGDDHAGTGAVQRRRRRTHG